MEWHGEEKRRFIRGEVYFKVFICGPEQHVLSAYTKNISESGLCAIFNEELQISSLVDLELYLQDEPTLCKGRIIWVKKLSTTPDSNSSLFDTGIEFLL